MNLVGASPTHESLLINWEKASEDPSIKAKEYIEFRQNEAKVMAQMAAEGAIHRGARPNGLERRP